MEKLQEAVSVMVALILACLACAARPARARYVYDAHPAGGYVMTVDEDSAHHTLSAHSKYYTNPKNMKLVNERAVDSYFRILRATPQVFAASRKDRSPLPELRQPTTVNTEPPNLYSQQKQLAGDAAYASRNHPRNDNCNEKEKVFTPVNQNTERDNEEISQPVKNGKDLTKHSAFDKHTILGKGSKKTNRRPHRAQNVHHITYLSQVRDKILHKSNLNSDNSRAMSRPHTGVARSTFDKQPYTARDNRKRNTLKDKESIPEIGDEYYKVHARNYKHLNVGDRYQQAWNRNPPAGAGVEGGYAESELSPAYALFYRMSHEPDLEHPPPLDAREDTSYHRGNYLDLNTARKHSSAIL